MVVQWDLMGFFGGLMGLNGILWDLPSGNLLHSCGKAPFCSWENPLFRWQFSIAMLNYQRVAIPDQMLHGWDGSFVNIDLINDPVLQGNIPYMEHVGMIGYDL